MEPRHLCYGGLRFELLGDLPPDGRASEHILSPSTPAVADVYCSVRRDGVPVRHGQSAGLQIVSAVDGATVFGPGIQVSVAKMGARRFAASARVGTPQLDDVLTPVVAAVCELVGGIVLHCAATDVVGGGLVLFVGPSGAGKTTAAGLVEGGAWFARDRVVMHRLQEQWHAWPLAGGTDAPNGRRCDKDEPRPVLSVLRVRRGDEVCLQRADLAQAALIVRESMLIPLDAMAANALDRAVDFAGSIPVGEVSTVLGHQIPGRLLTGGNRDR